MSKRTARARNVYLHIDDATHLEARALALRLRRTTESLYLDGILRVLGEHGVHVEQPPTVALTPSPTGSTVPEPLPEQSGRQARRC